MTESRPFQSLYSRKGSRDKNEENEKIKQITAELENMQNDNTKNEVVKKIKRLRPPQKLLIKGKNSTAKYSKTQQSKVRLLQNILKRHSIKVNSQEQSYHRHE